MNARLRAGLQKSAISVAFAMVSTRFPHWGG